MRVGRRRIAVVASVLAVLAAGTGIARAYTAPGGAGVSDAAGYFTFCADRQRDVAGITDDDLLGHPDASHVPTSLTYSIENYVYTDPGPTVGNDLPTQHPFVWGKSGIRYTGSGADDVRRILTTQWVEYADAARTKPVQVRCKMRTQESLVKPASVHQKFDDNATASSVPWGFGPGTATGTAKSCRQVNEAIVAKAWADLGAQQTNASFNYDNGAVVLGPETYLATGSQWTQSQPDGASIVTASGGVLTIADRSLNSPSDGAAPNDRLRGAYYCTFVAPEYIRDVMLNGLGG